MFMHEYLRRAAALNVDIGNLQITDDVGKHENRYQVQLRCMESLYHFR